MLVPISKDRRPIVPGLSYLGLVHWFLAKLLDSCTTQISLLWRCDECRKLATLTWGSDSCNNLWHRLYNHRFRIRKGRSFCRFFRFHRFSWGIPRSSFWYWSFRSPLHCSTILRTRATGFCRGSIPGACDRDWCRLISFGWSRPCRRDCRSAFAGTCRVGRDDQRKSAKFLRFLSVVNQNGT